MAGQLARSLIAAFATCARQSGCGALLPAIGWGGTASTNRLQRAAAAVGSSLLAVEDGVAGAARQSSAAAPQNKPPSSPAGIWVQHSAMLLDCPAGGRLDSEFRAVSSSGAEGVMGEIHD